MRTRLFAALAVCALTYAFALPLHAQEELEPRGGGEGRPQGMRIHVDVEDVDLRDVMDQIGRQVGRNILVDRNVNERVRISLRDIAWREAVELIARMTRCEVEELPGGTLMLTQPPKVTIQFTEANVRTVLQLLAAYSGKNIIISQDVRGEVTLDLKEVHWLRALHAIVKTVGDFEVVEETPDLLRVVSRSSIEQQLETQVFPLKYVRPPALYRAVPPRTAAQASAAQVFMGGPTAAAISDPTVGFTLFRALQTVVQQAGITGATLEYDSQTNAFIVTATTPLLRAIKRIIDKVDLRPAQLFTEVKFVTTRDNNNQEYGIEFGPNSGELGLNLEGPFPQGRATLVPEIDPSSVLPGPPTIRETARQVGETFPFLLGDDITDVMQVPAIIDLAGLDMVLNLIDRDDRARVIQSPTLFMMDNQDAVIFVGENVPYATLTTTPDANGNVQQQLAEGDDSPVSVGFSLFIQPHVIPDSDRIHMTVIPRVNDLTGTTSPVAGFERFGFGVLNIDLPRTREQALVTQVMLDDTDTAVLGGLLTETDIEVVERVPILSSIPIIGNIFTNTVRTRRLENLLIFITPTIVRQRETVNSIFLRSTRRLEETDYFYRTREQPFLEDDDEDQDYFAPEDGPAAEPVTPPAQPPAEGE